MKKRFETFARNLSKEDKVAVVYDSDADGFSAGVLAAKAITALRGKRPELETVQEHKRSTISAQTIRKLEEAGIQKVIFVDMAVEQDPASLQKVASFAETVIFDHHKIYEMPENERVILLKSQFFSEMDGSKYPTAKLVHDIFAGVLNMKPHAWIACIGVIGDMAYPQWKSFVDTALKEAGWSMDQANIHMQMVGATVTVHREGIRDLFNAYMDAPTPAALKVDPFMGYVTETNAELKRLLDMFDEKAEIIEGADLIFYMVESRYGMKSALINELSTQRFPNKTIIVMQEADNGMVTMSARRQDFKVRMNDLLEMATQGMDRAKAGGHIPAAGGILQSKDVPVFKQKIQELLKSGKARN